MIALKRGGGMVTVLPKCTRAMLRYLRCVLTGGSPVKGKPIMQDTQQEKTNVAKSKDGFEWAVPEGHLTQRQLHAYAEADSKPSVRVRRQAEFIIDIPEHHIKCTELTAQMLCNELNKIFGGSIYKGAKADPQGPFWSYTKDLIGRCKWIQCDIDGNPIVKEV